PLLKVVARHPANDRKRQRIGRRHAGDRCAGNVSAGNRLGAAPRRATVRAGESADRARHQQRGRHERGKAALPNHSIPFISPRSDHGWWARSWLRSLRCSSAFCLWGMNAWSVPLFFVSVWEGSPLSLPPIVPATSAILVRPSTAKALSVPSGYRSVHLLSLTRV